ncbi:hypothetical protein GGI22_006262, partial [Coemansia erecta]
MDTTTSSSGGIPTALRHLLNKGAKNHHHHAPQIDGIVRQTQKPTDSVLASPMHENPYPSNSQKSSPAPSMYYTQRTLVASDPTIHISARSSLDMNVRFFVNNSDAAASAAVAAAAAAAPQSVRTTAPPSSNSNISSNSGGIGAWLSRYSLRPTSNTGSRASANSTASSAASVSTINTVTSSEYARHSIDNTLANMQLTTSQQHYYQHQPQPQPQTQTQHQLAVAAAITNVELCEASPSASSTATAGLRKSSSRNKRHVVYRILVSGRDGQWWAMRRYSEFYDLYSILKKKAPQHTFSCATGVSAGASARLSDLFPTKRW